MGWARSHLKTKNPFSFVYTNNTFKRWAGSKGDPARPAGKLGTPLGPSGTLLPGRHWGRRSGRYTHHQKGEISEAGSRQHDNYGGQVPERSPECPHQTGEKPF